MNEKRYFVIWDKKVGLRMNPQYNTRAVAEHYLKIWYRKKPIDAGDAAVKEISVKELPPKGHEQVITRWIIWNIWGSIWDRLYSTSKDAEQALLKKYRTPPRLIEQGQIGVREVRLTIPTKKALKAAAEAEAVDALDITVTQPIVRSKPPEIDWEQKFKDWWTIPLEWMNIAAGNSTDKGKRWGCISREVLRDLLVRKYREAVQENTDRLSLRIAGSMYFDVTKFIRIMDALLGKNEEAEEYRTRIMNEALASASIQGNS